jgi:hypothetical protein
VSEEGGGRVQTLALDLDVLDAASCADRHANAVLKNASIEISDDESSLISLLSDVVLSANRNWLRSFRNIRS